MESHLTFHYHILSFVILPIFNSNCHFTQFSTESDAVPANALCWGHNLSQVGILCYITDMILICEEIHKKKLLYLIAL